MRITAGLCPRNRTRRTVASTFANSLAGVLCMALASCSGGGGSSTPAAPTPTPTPTPPAPTVTSVTVTGPSCTAAALRTGARGMCSVTAGQTGTIQLTATATLSDGATQTVTSSATWASTNAAVATVSSSGLVTVRGAGDTDVTALYQGRMGGQTVHVNPAGPRTTFGAGQYLVNSEIIAGRYYSDPVSGCYFERQRGLGGNLSDIIANEFIGYNAGQWIVDISGTDLAFETDSDCGTWFLNSPRRGFAANITPGMWVVGSQITPGVYRAAAKYGCYWERLSDFSNTLDGVLANDFVSADGSQLVEIRSTDVGFDSDDDCGTWTPVTTLISGESVMPRGGNIEQNWRQHRAYQQARHGLPR